MSAFRTVCCDLSREWARGTGFPPRRTRFLKFAALVSCVPVHRSERANRRGVWSAIRLRIPGPRIASEKLNGLKQHYAADDRACKLFRSTHEGGRSPLGVLARIISELVEQDECQAAEALDGVSQAARALWTALDGIERER